MVRASSLRPEWHEGATHVKMGGKNVLARGDSRCKGPEAERSLACLRARKATVAGTQ